MACFASHMHRVQQIIDVLRVANGRKVATLGRSMGKNVQLGVRLGIITVPKGSLVDIEEVDTVPPGRDVRHLHPDPKASPCRPSL